MTALFQWVERFVPPKLKSRPAEYLRARVLLVFSILGALTVQVVGVVDAVITGWHNFTVVKGVVMALAGSAVINPWLMARTASLDTVAALGGFQVTATVSVMCWFNHGLTGPFAPALMMAYTVVSLLMPRRVAIGFVVIITIQLVMMGIFGSKGWMPPLDALPEAVEAMRTTTWTICGLLSAGVALMYAHFARQAEASLVAEARARQAAADTLRLARDDAQAGIRARDEFLSVVSHELRTPLNGVMGFARLLQDTELDSVQRRYAGTILRSSDSLLRLVNDILDLSRLGSGSVSVDRLDFHPRQLISDVVGLHQALAAEKGLRLRGVCSDALPERLIGDEPKLRQVLTNLVSNAIKFTREGEVRVEADLFKRQDAHAPLVRIVVEDTGIGIPADRLDRVFERFVQADNSTAREFGGSGLGLTISRELIQLLGGELTLESREQVGTRAIVVVPLAQPSTESTLESGATIGLWIDDDVNRLLVDAILRNQGYEVAIRPPPGSRVSGHVCDGQAAVEALRLGDPRARVAAIARNGAALPLGVPTVADPITARALLSALAASTGADESSGEKMSGSRMDEATSSR